MDKLSPHFDFTAGQEGEILLHAPTDLIAGLEYNCIIGCGEFVASTWVAASNCTSRVEYCVWISGLCDPVPQFSVARYMHTHSPTLKLYRLRNLAAAFKPETPAPMTTTSYSTLVLVIAACGTFAAV